MTEHDPQPGELWRTIGGDVVEMCEDGWRWPGGMRSVTQNHAPDLLVGYTREYVENLRAERDQTREYGETVERHYNATNAELVELRAEVEKLRAANTGDGEALAQLVRDVRDAPDPGHTVEIDGVLIGKKSRWLGDPDRKPWEVLREAESIANNYAALTLTARCEMLTLARELEAKAAEDSRREQLIEKAGHAYGQAEGAGLPHHKCLASAVDAVLAGDDQ